MENKPEFKGWLKVSLLDNGNVSFRFAMAKDSQPEMMGNIIAGLTSRRYNSSIVNAIQDYIDKTGDKRGRLVIDAWLQQLKTVGANPVVRPREAFPRSNNGR